MRVKYRQIILILSFILLFNLYSFNFSNASEEGAWKSINYKTLNILDERYDIVNKSYEKYINDEGDLVGLDDRYTNEYYKINYNDISVLDIEVEVLKYEDTKEKLDNESGLNTPIENLGLYEITLLIITLIATVLFILWIIVIAKDMFGKD